MTTYDSDRTDEIDIGESQNTAMTKPGKISLFSAKQTGVNKYEFSMLSKIPLKKGDKIIFRTDF